jgi:ABC-2 type transport system permease protein
MRKTSHIIKQELFTTFRRPSYLFFAFGIPVLAVLILTVINFIQGRPDDGTTALADTESEWQMEKEGFVDQSGLIQVIPDDLPVGHLSPYLNETQAQHALEVGEITAYYLIPQDYVEHGEIIYVYPDSRSYLSDGQSWVMRWTLTVNLLEGNQDIASQIWNPIWHLDERIIAPQTQESAISSEDCTRPGSVCESNELVHLMPSIMVALFFIAFMSSSSMLFNSIGVEKENSTIEVLMMSIRPRQLLAGKTLALGFAGLSQTAVWLAAIYILFNLGRSALRLPDGFAFPLDILVWGMIFFLGGFGLYASLMAGAGALVSKMKEAGIANFLAMIPLFFGYIFGLLAPLAGVTDTGFLSFLSFFPFTSPVVMIMRLTDNPVPLWHLLLSAGLLFISAYLALQIVSAMFHSQNLLSGQPFTVKRYLRALTGRA